MWRSCALAVLAIALVAGPASAAEITGRYVEVRTCDVWTGPCFANAEGNLTGKNAAMVWQIDAGAFDGVELNGLSVVAVVQATDTLGARQSGKAKAILLVDSQASASQRQALVKFAQRQAGDLLEEVVDIRVAPIAVSCCNCDGEGCSEIDAGIVKIKTRCLDGHDKICGNETAYYPPLIAGVQCIPAVAEHAFTGRGLATTWQESERRGAYVGIFVAR